MGCTGSKLDDLPAVALCRERCSFLDEAIHQRYVLAEAHMAYLHSLKAVGLSLHRFFSQDLANPTAAPPSPLLNLPTQRKGDPQNSDSGHLHLPSDSDFDDSLSGSPLHHDHDSGDSDSSPLHSYDQINSYPGGGAYEGGGGFMNMNYMKNKATPSVSYEQKPMSPETMHMNDASSSYYPYQYANQNPSSYPYYGYSNYGGGSPSPYGSSSYPPPPLGAAAEDFEASTSKPPPPPPSPPKSSAWDFLYPFESSENYYYTSYTPTRDLKQLREEEGIPDLEDEDFQQEVVKEVYAEPKFVDGGGKKQAKAVVEDEGLKANGSDSVYHTKPMIENDPVEYEVHMVGNKIVDNGETSGDGGNVATFKARGGGLTADSDVVMEIQVQFERAAESGSELAKMLEVGKFPYKKNAVYQVSAKMLHVITTPSLPIVSSQASSSKTADPSSIEKADPASLEIDDVGMGSGNLSSTLQKLYLWEKKLYEEVKVEEKMRVLHDRKSRKLKRLDERGAEAHKVDVTRTLVRNLSTKIRIAIQVVDKISVKINKLRDEELWPQLNDFIQGLTRMWKSMLECHRSQCQAIVQARRLDAVTSLKHFSDAHFEATLQLEHELLSWTLRFSCWVGAQKGYVKALNNWLLKCLIYEPEETDDGVAPFSPSRIGAPPVFVICNQWSQALEGISEKEVVDSMRDFATSVLQLWERDKLLMRQKMMANKDTEKKVKILDRQGQKIQKEIQALDKTIILVSSGNNGLPVSGHVYQSDTSKTGSLQLSLQRIFEAMEKFTADSLKVYEDLLKRIEEIKKDSRDTVDQENENVS
ncbi:hypothetical protein CsSME_00025711 [Camellia sinensis var. sinensis]